MKTLVSIFGLFFIFIAPVYSELSPQDLDKIRLLIKDEISIFETKVIDEIAKSEKRMKDYWLMSSLNAFLCLNKF